MRCHWLWWPLLWCWRPPAAAPVLWLWWWLPLLMALWQAAAGTSYQLGMWLPYLERLGKPFIVVVRTRVNFDEAVALTVGLQAAAQSAVAGMAEASVRALTTVLQVLPPRLRRRADALRAVCDLDLSGLEIDPPRGFGRD